MSRCLASGVMYEKHILSILYRIHYESMALNIGKSAGATADTDIPFEANAIKTAIEAKNGGAFEGGSVTLKSTNEGMKIVDEGIHKDILGNRMLYDGSVLPWVAGVRTMNEWNAVKHVFEPDIYIDAPSTAIADYYQKKGSDYFQVKGKGLYHTGNDVLGLGVPLFEFPIRLRIRVTKHKRKGIPTDVTAALVYRRCQIKKSPYDLEGVLPPKFKLAAE